MKQNFRAKEVFGMYIIQGVFMADKKGVVLQVIVIYGTAEQKKE